MKNQFKKGVVTYYPEGDLKIGQTEYTNIAVTPKGTLRPWRGIKTTTHPPLLKTDGQITWLPKDSSR